MSAFPFRSLVFGFSLCAFSTAPFSDARSDEGEVAKLEAFFRTYLDEVFELRPYEATLLGDHRFDHRLDDISGEARKRWLSHYQSTLEKLKTQFDEQKLSPSIQVDFQIFRDELNRNIWLSENTKPFEEDPRTYGTYVNDSVYILLTQSTLDREKNIQNSISRIKEIPRILEVAKQTLTHPPRSVLETAIVQNKGAIQFYKKDIFDLVGSTPQMAELKSAIEVAVESLQTHQQFLEEDLLPRADGEWRLGNERFYRKLELVLDLGRNADEVLKDAETEFDRVQNELYIIARQLWSHYFPSKVLPVDDARGRREAVAAVVHAVSQEHGTPEALIIDARSTVTGLKEFIHSHDILRLPKIDRCEVIEMPEFRRGNSLAYLEPALPLDPNGASFYAVSPPPAMWDAARVTSFLEEYNRHMLQVLSIHEAYPGHYVQLEYSNRCPSLIRKILQSGVYIEGWAVYTEQMMLDQGYGDGSLQLRLNQLKFYLRAIANTILDHRMHCTDMTDQEALRFLMQDAFQAEGEARLKIIRAKQSSVQLSTYFTGRMAHYRLRQSIQRELGDKFELGRFHEAVLECGSVPMKFLPGLVRKRLEQPRS
jgi:uncharacterized protein (DUF885 family)